MNNSRFAAIILAAGEGTQMNSAIPKVLHPAAGEPMIAHLLRALRPLASAATVVVIEPAQTAVQDPPLGTGDAVRTALHRLGGRLALGGRYPVAHHRDHGSVAVRTETPGGCNPSLRHAAG